MECEWFAVAGAEERHRQQEQARHVIQVVETGVTVCIAVDRRANPAFIARSNLQPATSLTIPLAISIMAASPHYHSLIPSKIYSPYKKKAT